VRGRRRILQGRSLVGYGVNHDEVREMGKGGVQAGEDGLDRDFDGRFLDTDLLGAALGRNQKVIEFAL